VHSFHGPLLMSLREARTAAPVMGQRGTYEHRDFVEAIAKRNVEEATAIMRKHIERTAKVLSKAKD
jgi:DNA-binding GntR family transcriptional regulator